MRETLIELLRGLLSRRLSWRVKLTMPFRFALAAWRAVQNRSKGLPFLAHTETQEERKAVCSGCEFYEDGVCGVCGCSIELKSMIYSEFCPIGKWQ